MRTNNILSMFRRTKEENSSTQRHIQNALIKFKLEEREGRSPLQQFVKLLKEKSYYFSMTRHEEGDVVGDIFFSHPLVTNLLNAFPYVIQRDCTYGTNCYGLKLL